MGMVVSSEKRTQLSDRIHKKYTTTIQNDQRLRVIVGQQSSKPYLLMLHIIWLSLQIISGPIRDCPFTEGSENPGEKHFFISLSQFCWLQYSSPHLATNMHAQLKIWSIWFNAFGKFS